MPDITPGPITATAPQVPVRDSSGARLPLQVIRAFVIVALGHVRRNPDKLYYVKQDGWGYHRRDIAPMFNHCPSNVMLPYGFIF